MTSKLSPYRLLCNLGSGLLLGAAHAAGRPLQSPGKQLAPGGLPSLAPSPEFDHYVAGLIAKAPGDTLFEDATAGQIINPKASGRRTQAASIPGAIPMSGANLVGYGVELKIGSASAKPLTVLFDTGSATSAVMSEATIGFYTNATTGESVFKVISDPTFVITEKSIDQGLTMSQSYGQGQWEGTVYRDKMSLQGGVGIQQSFVAISSIQDMLLQSAAVPGRPTPSKFRGILGAANHGPGTTLDSFFSVMNPKGPPKDFSLALCNTDGNMWMGEAPAQHLRQPMVYMATKESSHSYTIQWEGLEVGGVALKLGAARGSPLLVDSGSSFGTLPALVADRLIAAVASLSGRPEFIGDFAGANCLPLAPSATLATMDALLPNVTYSLRDLDSGALHRMTLQATQSYMTPVENLDGGTSLCATLRRGEDAMAVLGSNSMTAGVFHFKHDRIGFAEGVGVCKELK